jgi:hypothetical protein
VIVHPHRAEQSMADRYRLDGAELLRRCQATGNRAADIAVTFDQTEAQVNNCEWGNFAPPAAMLRELCNLLDSKPNDLLVPAEEAS